MKRCAHLILVVFVLLSCKNNSGNYTSFGIKINDSNTLSASQMIDQYEGMNIGDTVSLKMMAKVDEVCQAKGCWMKLNLEDGTQAMVRFKDYGFFVPKDIAGKEVIVNGIAFVNEVSVEEQRHYALDAGQSKEEISKITEPKKSLSFLADGVLLKE